MNSSALLLFRSVGRAIAEKGLKELAGGHGFGPKLQEINGKIYEYFHKACRGQRYLDVIGAVAATEPVESKDFSNTVVGEIQADPVLGSRLESKEVAERLLAYLEQVPVTVRNRFRRPSDPSGSTVPPDFRISRPEELLVLLPNKAPKFRMGDQPVGNWELKQLLGIGAFGEVWKATDSDDSNLPPVALKFCLSPESVRYLKHETGLLQRIVKQVGERNGIVRLRQAWLDADPPCLEYEYVNGGDLCGLMSEWLNLQPERRVKLALQMLQRLAKTVSSLHEMNPPIVHRDLKPANVLVSRGASGKFDLKISDFGIGGLAAGKALEGHASGVSQAEILTQTLRGSHTPMYAGPEQQGGAPPHPSDDVHALGVIGFQLLVCDLRRGPSGDWDEELRERGVQEAAIGVLRRCLARQSRRFQNAGELKAGLEAILQGGETIAETKSGQLRPLPFETIRSPLPVDQPPRTVDGWSSPMPARKSSQPSNRETVVHPELHGSPPPAVPPLPTVGESASVANQQIEPNQPPLFPIDKIGPKKYQKSLTPTGLLMAIFILFIGMIMVTWITNQFPLLNSNKQTIVQNPKPFGTDQAINGEGINRVTDLPREVDKPAGRAEAGNQADFPDQNVFPLTEQQAIAAQKWWSEKTGLPIEKVVQLRPGTALKLILVPPGKFRMGSPPNEMRRQPGEQQHWVTITQPFYMSKYEISQDEWKAVMGTNPSRHAATGAASNLVPLNTGNYPVEEVSFNLSLDFCQKLPEINGWTALLPTEAEWEYACRAGSDSVFPWGNSLNGDRANCDGRYPYGVNEQGVNIGRPVKVGCYGPNVWGLHDMIGNVREWCLDSLHDFDQTATVDPIYINQNGRRVARGGSWGIMPWRCRISYRDDFDASTGNSDIGIRVIYKNKNLSVNYREHFRNNQEIIKKNTQKFGPNEEEKTELANIFPATNNNFIEKIMCSSPVYSVSFSKNGGWLATGNADSTSNIWSTKNGRPYRQLRGHDSQVLSVSFSPNSKLLATGSSDQTAKIWDIDTGKELRTLRGHRGSVLSLDFNPKSGFLLTGSGDKTLSLWNLQDGKKVRIFSGHTGPVLKAIFSPDGEKIASGSDDKTIIIWETATGKEIKRLTGHLGWVYGLSFSSDGKWLASGSSDKTIKVWNVSTGMEFGTLKGHNDRVYSVEFSPDGKLLASGSSDKTVRIWNPFNSQQIMVFEGHRDRVDSVAFEPTGSLVASGSADSTVIFNQIKKPEDKKIISGIKETKDLGTSSLSNKKPVDNVNNFSDKHPTGVNGHIEIAKEGLILLLDANNPLSFSGDGTIWRDVSGNNNHFQVNPRAFKQSANTKYMDFQGKHGIAIKLENNEVPLFDEMEIFVLTRINQDKKDWRTLFRAKNPSFGDHQVVILKGTNNIGFYEGSSNRFFPAGGLTGADISYDPKVFTDFCLWDFKYVKNKKLEKSMSIRFPDGKTVIEKNPSIIFDQGINAIGGFQTGPSQFWGDIAFVLIYKRLLTDLERKDIDAFSQNKVFGK
jgi:WD40 repeat protein/formylglycine-generating enzyme required for sulfatase activity/serine/threonine protein kinase